MTKPHPKHSVITGKVARLTPISNKTIRVSLKTEVSHHGIIYHKWLNKFYIIWPLLTFFI